MKFLIVFLSNAAILLPLDFLFIGTLGKQLFEKNIPDLLLSTPRPSAAVLFYVIYLAGLTVLVNGDVPANWARNAALGAVLGLTAYATFELTSMAVLKPWSWAIVVPDLIWGTVLTAITGALGGLLAAWIMARWL